MLNLFDILIKCILICGNDVWDIKSKLWGETDTVLQYARCILRVKAATRDIIIAGEYGRLSLITTCQIPALCFENRLHFIIDNLVKKVYCELKILNSEEFTTWTKHILLKENVSFVKKPMMPNILS